MKKLLFSFLFPFIFSSCKVEAQGGIAGFQTYLDAHWKNATAYHSLTASVEGAMLDSILHYITAGPTLQDVTTNGSRSNRQVTFGSTANEALIDSNQFRLYKASANLFGVSVQTGVATMWMMSNNTAAPYSSYFLPGRFTQTNINYWPNGSGFFSTTFDSTGTIRDSVTVSTGYTITIAGPSPFIVLDLLSGHDGTVTLPTAKAGTCIKIWNANGSGLYHWSFGGGVTNDVNGSAFTTLTNHKFYTLYNYDGTNWLVTP